MMGKISLQDLATTLQERRQLNKRNASRFVNEMFRIIQDSLDHEKQVKVKGLGTFRIIDVGDRESVNVNTGDRVLIEGHGKITFTPDALMKELVNKPFSQFETVVLNEGVDFEDAKSNDEAIVEPAIAEPSEEPEPIKASEPEPIKAPEPEPSEQEPEPIKAPEPEPSEQEPDSVLDSSQEEPVEVEEEEESERRKWKWPLIAVAACAIGFVVGYFVGKETSEQYLTPVLTIAEEPAPAEPAEDSLQAAPMKDTLSIAKGLQPDAMPIPAKRDAPIKVVEAPAKPAETPAATSTVDPDKYSQMDARIRTGAYRIVGLDHTERVRSSDNLARICKRTLGPGMECYIEAFNGIKGDADLKAGQEIKIPKLQLKKKKAQK